MHLAIVFAFSSLLVASLAGGTRTSDQGSKSNGSREADDDNALESPVHANYESMSNRKLWRELIKKRNQLKTAQRQWQHLLNLRQERMNKLSGKPLKYKIPSNGIPPEIIRQIEEILAYIPMDYKLFESEDGLEDKSMASFSRKSQGGLYQEWSSVFSRHQHGGYRHQGAGSTSLNQRSKPEVQPDVSSPAKGSTHSQTRVSHQTKQPQRPTQDQPQGVMTHVKLGVYPPGKGRFNDLSRTSHEIKQPQGLSSHVQWALYPLGEGSSYVNRRINHETKQLQELSSLVQSGVGPSGEGSNVQLRMSQETNQEQVYPPGEGSSDDKPRISSQTRHSQVYSPGEGTINLEPRMSDQTHKPQVYPPNEGSTYDQSKINPQIWKSQGLASQAQSGVYLDEGNRNVQPLASRESQPMSFGHPQTRVNPSVQLEASIHSNKVQGRVFPSTRRHFASDDDFSSTPLVIY